MAKMKNKENRKKRDWRKIVGLFLMIALVLSLVYAVIGLIHAPDDAEILNAGQIPKSSYVLMITQCVLGAIVMLLPSVVERRFSVSIPNYMYILYFIFLYCAIVLGEVRQFYYLVPNWDTYLHAFSGAMLGALGFTIVSIFNDSSKVSLDLSPKFVGLFSFCFALAAGAVWEIYEFLGDTLLGMNMQKFRTEDGIMFVGQAALQDTMEDLIVDACSALVMVLIGVALMKKERARFAKKQEQEQQAAEAVD